MVRKRAAGRAFGGQVTLQPAGNAFRVELRLVEQQELDLGETKANAQVAGFLFNSARTGNVTAQIFWLKTRARWRETPVENPPRGPIAERANE